MMTHMKRLSIPKSWPMPRKGKIFSITPSPGPHAKTDCMPLGVVLRDLLGYAENAREARAILSQGKVLVDKTARKDPRFPVGLMDVLELPDSRECFRMLTGAKGLVAEKAGSSESSSKVCRIRGKTTLRGGIQQLNLHDGRNILVKKDTYNVGDSITISLPDQKVLKHHRLEKGVPCLVVAGRNMGIRGKVKEIERKEHMLEKSTVTLETGKKDIKTLMGYIFITGKAPAKEAK